MKHGIGERQGVPARLSTSRMTPTERLDAAAAMRNGEALGDWMMGAGAQLRAASADLGRLLRRLAQGAAQFGSVRYDRR